MRLWPMRCDTTRRRLFCLPATLIWMPPLSLRLRPSAALSFKTHLQITMRQQHPAHSWRMDEPSIGFLHGVQFASANLMSTVRFRLPTIIRSQSIWRLFSRGPPVFMEKAYGVATSWLGELANSLNSLVPLVDREMNLR